MLETIAPIRNAGARPATPGRVAVLSVHTSPQDQPGTGDSGGMNVEIREVAERLAAQGVRVDVFTRCRGRQVAEVEEVGPGQRLIQVKAGPCAPVDKEDLPGLLPAFLGGVLDRTRREGDAYDVVHSHYWLSGWVGRSAKEIWGVPLVASFHTLGRVKNAALAAGEGPEPRRRLAGEEGVVAHADRILAPTPAEVANLVGLYGADPERIRIVPGGVDHSVFFPRDRRAARARAGLRGRPVLFVGRLQTHKGPDLAMRALARALELEPEATRDVELVVVGGPSGGAGHRASVERLRQLAESLGIAARVRFLPPQPQQRLADLYSGAEVVLVPSRSESFGLVALEAQASGTPVVAADAGGLRYVVLDGTTGFVVPGHDPVEYARPLATLLSQPRRARAMGRAAAGHALRFSWEGTAARVLEVYREVLTAPDAAPGSEVAGLEPSSTACASR